MISDLLKMEKECDTDSPGATPVPAQRKNLALQSETNYLSKIPPFL